MFRVFEFQENKKFCFFTASLALNSRLPEACRTKTKLFIPRDSTWPPSDVQESVLPEVASCYFFLVFFVPPPKKLDIDFIPVLSTFDNDLCAAVNLLPVCRKTRNTRVIVTGSVRRH